VKQGKKEVIKKEKTKGAGNKGSTKERDLDRESAVGYRETEEDRIKSAVSLSVDCRCTVHSAVSYIITRLNVPL